MKSSSYGIISMLLTGAALIIEFVGSVMSEKGAEAEIEELVDEKVNEAMALRDECDDDEPKAVPTNRAQRRASKS